MFPRPHRGIKILLILIILFILSKNAFIGGLRLLTAERVITRFQTQKTGALLACLACRLDRPHPRELLIEMLWPGGEPQAARNSLSVSLSSLRHQLEPPGVPAGSVILANRRDIALNPAAIVTDTAEFDRLLKDAAQTSGAVRIQCLTKAMALYQSGLLPGYYEAWIVTEQRRRVEQFFQTARSLATALVQAGDLPAAVQASRQAVLAEPLSEEAHRDLMRLLNELGRPEEAVRQYHALEETLRRELDAAPEPATQRLARQSETSIRTAAEPRPLRTAPDPPVLAPTPIGTVTFLLADSPAAGPPSPEQFTSLSRLARRSGGHRVAGVGGCLTFAFTRSSDALLCAVQSMRLIARNETENPPLRIALHTGEIGAKEGNPRDLSLRLAGSILQSALAGQVLCTEETACLLRRDLEPGLGLRDLGIYRLPERSDPERLYQIIFPEISPTALSSLTAQPGCRSGLPLQFTRFFGRETEIARLRETGGRRIRAVTILEEALPICRELEDRQRLAILLTNLGRVQRLLGDYDRATESYHEALAIQRALGDRIGVSRLLGNLGNLADDRGEPVQACALHRESLEIQRELGDKQGMTISLYNLAAVTRGLGEYAQAIRYHQESLKLCLELRDRLGVAYSLEELSIILLTRNDPRRAALLYAAAEALREQIDCPVPPLQQPRHEAHRAALQSALGNTAYAAARTAGRELPWQDAVASALAEKAR